MLPLPPIELRRAIGPTDPSWFDNPSGRGALDDLRIPGKPAIDYRRVLDFGCGCGRVARQMMQQKKQPIEYCGLDLNKAAIEWSAENLSPRHPGFTFRHLDFHNAQFNPGGAPQPLPFPVPENHYTLALACSVFTHIIESDIGFFFRECAKALADDGLLWSTWFVFDKRFFPALQPFQNALYINLDDPSNAVWYDVSFISRLHHENGLHICAVGASDIRGFQYGVIARKGIGQSLPFPDDLAPIGIAQPPVSLDVDGKLSDKIRTRR